MRVLVAGMLAGVPGHGGATWAVLQYLLGLSRLGHDVFFAEPVHAPEKSGAGDTATVIRDRYFHEVVGRFGLTGRASLVDQDTRETVGATYPRLRDFAGNADLLVNLSGVLTSDDLVGSIPTRLYVDLDPGFTQLWAHAEGIEMGFDRHTHHATVGLAVAEGRGPIPGCGVDWIPTLPPVVLEYWPMSKSRDCGAYTSIANWRGYGSIEHAGLHYGQKAHSFRAFADLPGRTAHKIEIALGIHPSEEADLSLLSLNGWVLTSPERAAGTPLRYEQFVCSSRGELGIAKTGYVVGRTGWFSDRSACYLASGRPVVAQDTGFARYLPTGRGLLSFANADEAVEALESVEADYEGHRRAAREFAEERLDSDLVLSTLLESVLGARVAV